MRCNNENLNNLRALNLEGNEISSVEFARNKNRFESLKELNLNSNRIKFFEPTQFAFVNLRSLHIDDNNLKKFSVTNTLPRLRALSCQNNRIAD